MSKIIGIPGWVIENKYFGLTVPYMEFAQSLGEVRILNNSQGVQEDLDLLILPGGLDVNPARHGKNIPPSFYTGNSNAHLEYFDQHKLPGYVENGTPILSICRGAQSLFTMFGGTMAQHNYLHTQSSHPKDECHRLELSEHFPKLKEQPYTYVNSRHHQTMTSKNLPEVIIPLAYSVDMWGKRERIDKDIIEIFTIADKPILGLQYHPEDCPNGKPLTDFLINRYLSK